MANHLEIESLDKLIAAVREYQNDLAVNRQILINAANVCDAAMGSDAIAQKHIPKLYAALDELSKTSQIAADVTEALIKDRARALEVYEG